VAEAGAGVQTPELVKSSGTCVQGEEGVHGAGAEVVDAYRVDVAE
jgi:hypothetical protein